MSPAPPETAGLREELHAEIAGIIRSEVSEFLGGLEGIDAAAREILNGPLAQTLAALSAALAERDEARSERDAALTYISEWRAKQVDDLDAVSAHILTTIADECRAGADAATTRADHADRALTEARERIAGLEAESGRLKAQAGILMKVIDAGKCEAAFALVDEADGSSTATTRRVRLENIRNALDGVGDLEARKALGLLVETIDGELARTTLTHGAANADAS